ncbi:MAG: HD domain-containing protein [Comamonas sp.]|uniref:HD-GYP domain-containing protein n=1 Tax=Comamonas TaxID=283 RepID=UPI000C17EC3F|nr:MULTISPECIES: HD domain-containing phosphohydrolase [Comamonas]PIG09767.1 putative two-component system response regulator [Comamonas sp. 26]WQD44705.1 HD domain-containing protein [Comamonas testosteroni]
MNQAIIETTQFDPAAAVQMEKIISDLGRMYQERNEALQEVARAHHEALFLLTLAAEYKDDDTGVHIVRIGFLAEALALLLGQSKAYAELLRKAAPMHDVGKIGIPDSVLKKPGAFKPEEREIMNRHPSIGADILGKSRIALFQLAAEVALTHHERWDGTGYPRQLAGTDIPLSGRIVAVVDCYDALTMDRVYRPALSHEEALDIIIAQRATAYDTDVVDCFTRNHEALRALRERITERRMTFADLVESEHPIL